MPIYAYKCSSCGLAKDVLRKVSDEPLSDCPACGKATFQKQLTAAGFQLKGSGWYVTDFKGGKSAAASGEKDGAVKADDAGSGKSEAEAGSGAKTSEKAPDAGAKAPDKAVDKPASKPAASPASSAGAAGEQSS